MEQHELNASSFAEQIGVGRSSISHILSGRNKPSLDFVMSITDAFSDVDLYWLLNGKGSVPKSETVPSVTQNPTSVSKTTTSPLPKTESSPSLSADLFSNVVDNIPEERPEPTNVNKGKNVSRVMLLYDDGTFESFESS